MSLATTQETTASAARQHRGGASDSGAWLMLAPVTLFMVVFFILPLGYMVWISLSDPMLSLANYKRVFTSALIGRVMGGTFLTALVVTVTCLICAYPVAYYAATRKGVLSAVLIVGVTLSFWISFIVRTYAWMIILGNRGPIVALLERLGFDPAPRILFTSTATVIGLTHIMLPYMVLTLYAVMTRIEPNLRRAALGLGATPGRAFWNIYLPLSLPGVVNGCLLAFIFCIGFYVTPALLGSPNEQMIAGLIAKEINEMVDWGLASAMSILLLLVTMTLILIYDRLFGLDRLWG